MLLADAYIHVEFSDKENFANLTTRLENGVIRIARDIYVNDAEIEYLLEEGTLRQRARILKLLAYLLGTIAGYHELRESIFDIYKDADFFAQAVIKEFYKVTKSSPSSVIYKRTIPHDVRALHRIVQTMDRLENESLTPEKRREAEDELISSFAILHYSNPDDEGVQTVLNNLPRKKIPELPSSIAAIVDVDQRRRKREAEKRPDVLERASAGPPSEARKRRRYRHVTLI